MAVSIIATVIVAGFIIQYLLRLKEKRDEVETREKKVPQHSDPAYQTYLITFL